MPEKWTGRLIGRMHNERITYEQLANEMGVNKAYISMILNGKRKPPNIQKRMEAALEAIIKREREKQSQKKGEIT
jgi:transcriptional regulator with XRE-family HTH domain|nr:MAG TPA: Regulatory protein [Bacteriophage sp.]